MAGRQNYKGEYRFCAMCKQPAVQDLSAYDAFWEVVGVGESVNGESTCSPRYLIICGFRMLSVNCGTVHEAELSRCICPLFWSESSTVNR
ncbi:MAG: hypothetical protein EPN85_13565 [Bacteroidetes bacterium]|nr:MAG: hypothetical protein EPN85_13565 [Bacteroidota bacterium]